METTKLYKNDRYLKEWDAVVTSVEKKDDVFTVTLDQTAFFPEGGGQSCDQGLMNDYKVVDVQEDGEMVIHTIKADDCDLKEGSAVHCSLDWARRFDNMQRHCGEHILSGIFFHMFGGVNRG